MDQQLFYYLAFVPLLGIVAQLVAWRLKIPSILLLLLFGIVLGQFIQIDQVLGGGSESATQQANALLFPLVSICVAIILFEGGLTLHFDEWKQAGDSVLRLCSIGVVVSWVLTSIAVWLIFHLDLRLAVLLGAILVVTGPTVIAPLIRNIRPEKRVGSILKWEGIVVDPIGAVLAVLVLKETLLVGEDHSWSFIQAASGLLGTFSVGIGIGLVLGTLIQWMLAKYWIPDYLHGVASLSLAIASFAISNALVAESGLVTVTTLGIYLANQKKVSVDHIVEFKEHLSVLVISCLFIVLGSRLDLSELSRLGLPGLLFIALLILIIRPISVMLALWRTKTTLQERIFLGFLAPRGIVAAAVTSAISLELAAHWTEHHGSQELIRQAEALVPITFLVIVTTVGVYGLSAGPLARLLKLAESNPQGVLLAGGSRWVQQVAKVLSDNGIATMMVDTNYRNVAEAKMDGITAHCSSVLSKKFSSETSFAGIGRMIALTGNDEVNHMACMKYQHLFGRASVFLLPRNPAAEGQRSVVSEQMPGRILFDGDHSSRKFDQLFREGFEVKATKISEEFSYEDFQELYGHHAVPLFLIDSSGSMTVLSTDEKQEPASKHTVIALVPAMMAEKMEVS